MNRTKKIAIALLIVCLLLGGSFTAWAAELCRPSIALERALAETGSYLLKKVADPQVGSVGGEWAVLGLARAGYNVPPDWYDAYYKNLEAEVKAKHGILHDKKYSEYSRVILTLSAIGKDPADVAGYNLLEKLGDFNKIIWQGINGPIFALIALDAGSYTVPACPEAAVRTTRELLLYAVSKRQLPDGGFALSGRTGDPDITAMALQALAPYQDRTDIRPVIEKALACLSRLQNSDGGYTSWGSVNSESTVQVLVALTALGIDPRSDSRFIKDNGKWLLSNLLTYYVSGGGFKHILEQKEPDGMATEQAFYGLVAYDRFLKGKNGLYIMSDAKPAGSGQVVRAGALPGKHPDVKAGMVNKGGLSLSEISKPDHTMTRAEMAEMIVGALGLPLRKTTVFADVPAASPYHDVISTAYSYGIIAGRSDTAFAPQDGVTRQEAAVMVARTAKLCGMDTAADTGSIRDMLAQFTDYMQVAEWARESMAFCYSAGILDQSDLEIQPGAAITREQTGQMLFNLLVCAKLL